MSKVILPNCLVTLPFVIVGFKPKVSKAKDEKLTILSVVSVILPSAFYRSIVRVVVSV